MKSELNEMYNNTNQYDTAGAHEERSYINIGLQHLLKDLQKEYDQYKLNPKLPDRKLMLNLYAEQIVNVRILIKKREERYKYAK